MNFQTIQYLLEFMLKNQFFLLKNFLDTYPLISATFCTFICPYSVGWSNNSILYVYIRRDKKGGAQLFLLLLPTIVHVCVRNSYRSSIDKGKELYSLLSSRLAFVKIGRKHSLSETETFEFFNFVRIQQCCVCVRHSVLKNIHTKWKLGELITIL